MPLAPHYRLRPSTIRGITRDIIGKLGCDPNYGRHVCYFHGLCAFIFRPILPGLI